MEDLLSTLLDQGIKKKVYPGAAAGLSIGFGADRSRHFSCAGIKDTRFPDEKVTKETFFDLASLTKPLSTALIIYSLIEEKKISFADPLSDFFKKITFDKKNITIRQLLSHSSGFKGYYPYFKDFYPVLSKDNCLRLLEKIFSEKLEYRAETKCCYSDLGFILLGLIIEKVTGNSLEELFRNRIASPMGLEREIRYIGPFGDRIVDKKQFASTEDCPWRKRIMRAEVHDEHSWLMNGIAGHAGLFGKVGAVVSICEEILDQYKKRGAKRSWSETLQTGLQQQYINETWCLGFDSPSLEGSSGGEYLSAQSVGHLGYAGTSFWIDPEKEIVIVLLTNRVHPTRDNIKIRSFRPHFHNQIFQKLGYEKNKKGC